MIDLLISKQKQSVRDNSYVLGDRIFIPAKLRYRELVRDFKNELKEKEFNDEKALVASLSAIENKTKSIYSLLASKGR